MPSPPSPPRRGAVERGLAWLHTGPLGHLYSTVADLAVYAAARARARARRRPVKS